LFNYPSNSVILDTGAQISVFNNLSLLHNIHESTITININGISKHSQPISTNTIGKLHALDKIPIYYSPHVKRNIISFNDAINHYYDEWNDEDRSFIINTDKDSLKFHNTSNVFSRHFNNAENLLTTVQQNMSKYTSTEVKRAELVKEIQL
jgi:7-cyano-7-deazaguanine synthase in queuosine biosynthesis